MTLLLPLRFEISTPAPADAGLPAECSWTRDKRTAGSRADPAVLFVQQRIQIAADVRFDPSKQTEYILNDLKYPIHLFRRNTGQQILQPLQVLLGTVGGCIEPKQLGKGDFQCLCDLIERIYSRTFQAPLHLTEIRRIQSCFQCQFFLTEAFQATKIPDPRGSCRCDFLFLFVYIDHRL